MNWLGYTPLVCTNWNAVLCWTKEMWNSRRNNTFIWFFFSCLFRLKNIFHQAFTFVKYSACSFSNFSVWSNKKKNGERRSKEFVWKLALETAVVWTCILLVCLTQCILHFRILCYRLSQQMNIRWIFVSELFVLY